MGEITLCLAQTVNTEQLQHCIPQKHGSFQACNCKYPVKSNNNDEYDDDDYDSDDDNNKNTFI